MLKDITNSGLSQQGITAESTQDSATIAFKAPLKINDIKKKHREKKTEDRKSWGEFGGGPGEIGGFSVGVDGFLVGVERTQKGTAYAMPTAIGLTGLRIIKRLLSPNSDNKHAIWVTLSFLDSENIEQKVNVPYPALKDLRTGKGDAENLTKRGFAIPAKLAHAELIATCMQVMYKELSQSKAIETLDCVVRPGWHGGEHIFPGNEHEKFAGNDPAMLSKAGDPEIWKKTISKLLIDNPVLVIMHSWGLAGFLKSKVFSGLDISPILNLYGEAAGGKTFSMKTLSSWQTSPSKLGTNIIDGCSTFVGAEIILQANNHGFVCIDEFGATIDNIFSPLQHIMKLCNNGSRQKGGGPGGGLAESVRSWDCMIVTNGNLCICDNLSKGHNMYVAAASRMLEIDTDKHPIWAKQYSGKQIHQIEKNLSENFGHGYEMIIKHIIENQETLIEKFLDLKEDVSEAVLVDHQDFLGNEILLDERSNEVSRRLLTFYCMVRVTIEMLEKLLDVDFIEAQKKLGEIFNEALTEHSTAQKKATAQSAMMQWFHSNTEHFLIKNYLHHDCVASGNPENQKINAKYHNETVKQKWGEWRQAREMMHDTDFDGTLYIYSVGEERAQDAEVNIEKATKQAIREKWAARDAHNKKPMVKGIGRCAAFNLCCSDDGLNCTEESDGEDDPPPF